VSRHTPLNHLNRGRSRRMWRRVTIIVAIGSLIVAALWLKLRRRQTSVPRAELAYVPNDDRVRAHLQRPSGAEPASSGTPKEVRAQTEFERAIGPPQWNRRPDGEWQGMLVNRNVQPPCDGPERFGM